MKDTDSTYNYELHNRSYGKKYDSPCYEHKRSKPDCDPDCPPCKHCEKEICISNNPVIKICVNGAPYEPDQEPDKPKPFRSGYLEALGTGQTVYADSDIVFDINSVDSVGECVTLNTAGTLFTITRPGLYLVEWNLNLVDTTTCAVVGILENGEPASGSTTVTGGNFASGTLIHVTTVPFTLSLHNYNGEIILEDTPPFEDSAASIRIARFADGAIR